MRLDLEMMESIVLVKEKGLCYIHVNYEVNYHNSPSVSWVSHFVNHLPVQAKFPKFGHITTSPQAKTSWQPATSNSTIGKVSPFAQVLHIPRDWSLNFSRLPSGKRHTDSLTLPALPLNAYPKKREKGSTKKGFMMVTIAISRPAFYLEF